MKYFGVMHRQWLRLCWSRYLDIPSQTCNKVFVYAIKNFQKQILSSTPFFHRYFVSHRNCGRFDQHCTSTANDFDQISLQFHRLCSTKGIPSTSFFKRTEHTTRCLGAYLYCSAVVSKLLSVNPTGCTFRRVKVLRATCIGSSINMPITTNGEHMVIAMLVTTSFIITTPTMKYMQRFSVKNFLRQIVNGSMPVSFIVN